MTYREVLKIVRRAGMSVEDGVAFTVCGSQLVDGRDAPPEIAAMNGWAVEHIAEALSNTKGRPDDQRATP